MTLKLRPIASNMTELNTGTYTILFSYQTPVACHKNGEGYYKTDCRFSVTTSKHISKWLAGAQAEFREQRFFDNLVA